MALTIPRTIPREVEGSESEGEPRYFSRKSLVVSRRIDFKTYDLKLKTVVPGPIAQLVEHRADNAGVTGAIPVRPTMTSVVSR